MSGNRPRNYPQNISNLKTKITYSLRDKQYLVCFASMMVASFFPTVSLAQTPSMTWNAIYSDIKEVCTQPATAGQHWTAAGTAAGDVELQVNDAAAAGNYNFTKEEWNGIQNVLKTDQANDNDSYRKCTETLAAIFSKTIPTVVKSQIEIERQLKGFLLSNQLPLPGTHYSDLDLSSQFLVTPMPTLVAVSYSILSGTFRGLTSTSTSPLSSYNRMVLQKDGSIVGVMIQITCHPNGTSFCEQRYNDWQTSLEQIEGSLQDKELKFGGGPAGPFSEVGTAKDSVAYDDQWRVLVSRIDMQDATNPTTVVLLVAGDPP